jgi:ParB family chromosome partitioning protein
MAEPKQLPPVSMVALGDVEACHRLRPVSDAAVGALIASIGEMGMMKDPIHVRRTRDGTLHLVAGGHRLEAARRLGWETVPAFVHRDMRDDDARLMEIDDNLCHAEMSPLELAVFCAERKRLYEKLHPETRAGHAGAAMRWTSGPLHSFSAVVAEKRGLSERHVRRIVAAGESLDPRDRQLLHAAPRPPTLKDLLALAKATAAPQRYDAVEAFAAGRAKTIAQALKGPVQERAERPAEAVAARLVRDWKRAPMAARRAFLEAIAEDLAAMRDAEPGA